MNKRTTGQNADFLSIALEECESDNYEMAREFIDDVRVNLLNANRETQSQKLQHALNCLDDGEYDDAQELVGGVYDSLLEEL